MTKDTYYKLMRFGPHMRLSLYMLFKHKSLFFAYKNVLNDPTDCSPYFYVELNDSQLERRVKEIFSDTGNEDPRIIRDAQQILEMFDAERGQAPERKALPRSRFLRFGYFPSKATAIDIAREFVAYHMRLQVDEARIFSMSKKWDEPRLWAHYADSHTGVCIELGGIEHTPEGVILDRVDYTTRRPRISVADIKGMASNDKTRSEIYSRMFFQKSTGWDYEDEQRLVIPKAGTARSSATLRFPEGDYIQFQKLKIKSILFGMNCSRGNKQMVTSLVDQFLEKRSKHEILNVLQSEDNYQINSAKEESFEVPF